MENKYNKKSSQPNKILKMYIFITGEKISLNSKYKMKKNI